MAHSNIDERREFVSNYMGTLGVPRRRQMLEIAALFGASAGAIHADVIWIKNTEGVVLTAPPSVKNRVKERDSHTCQYCSKRRGSMISEHVVPTILGGPGKEYNLVCACNSCNLIKRSKVWIPINFDVLKALNPEWAEKIESMAVRDCRKRKRTYYA